MKTAVVLCLAAFVAVACATECDSLTRLKIKAQWSRAFSSGHDREDFVTALWRSFFAQAPDARSLFARVGGDNADSPAFKAHAARVLAGLDIAISLLDQPETLKSELDHLHAQHVERHIPDKYYTTFRSALGQVLPAQLGRCYDKEAWKVCFDVIAGAIRG